MLATIVEHTMSKKIIANESKITALKAENPFTPGSKVFKRIEAVRKAKTVEQAKAKGGDAWAVRTAVALKLVKVAA